jgi:Helix-turn-helix domain
VIKPDTAGSGLREIQRQVGVDLSVLPPVMSTEELADVLGVTPGSLAQDRYRGCGIPYVKIGRRVRYLTADFAHYLATHRTGGDGTP